MKPSTELFELIKSLSKSEKRFFKLSSSLQSGEKNYLKIFDAIEKQSSYDEDAIKKQFKNEKFVKHFPSEKNHLYKIILKSLRSYHADNSISGILKQELKNIEILYKKALYKECNKFVSKAKKLAIQHEKIYYWFELINWEKTLLEEAYESGNFDLDLDKLIEEEAEVIEKLRNLAEYHYLYSKINHIFRSGGFARNNEEKEAVAEIENYHLIKGKNTALTSRAASICYYIKGLCASTNRDYESAFTFFNRVKDILDNNPLIKQDLAKRYVRTLRHLLLCYVDAGNFKAAEELMVRMQKLPKEKGFKSVDIQVKIFTTTSITHLMIGVRRGDFKSTEAMLEDIIKNMEAFGDKINKEKELIFAYNIAYVYFGSGEYNKALFWINRVLNENEQNLRQDIFSFARIFNLIIHYELENLDLLEYIIKSTNRYLSKSDKDFNIEKLMLKHIRRLAKNPGEEETLKEFNSMLNLINESFKTEREKVILDYFDVKSWAESKVKKESFAQSIMKNSKELA